MSKIHICQVSYSWSEMIYLVSCNRQKTVQEQCTQLAEAEQWASLIDYTLIAWSYVRATPQWDASHHNNTRRFCFKTLAQYCLQGLKEVKWNRDQLENLLKK